MSEFESLRCPVCSSRLDTSRVEPNDSDATATAAAPAGTVFVRGYCPAHVYDDECGAHVVYVALPAAHPAVPAPTPD